MKSKEQTNDQLMGEVVDKINLLNRIQMERMDQFREIIRSSCVDDLKYLVGILNKELEKYPEHLEVK